MNRIFMFVAFHLPRKLVYWCAVRVGAYGTTGEYSNTLVPNLTMMEALSRWDKGMEENDVRM